MKPVELLVSIALFAIGVAHGLVAYLFIGKQAFVASALVGAVILLFAGLKIRDLLRNPN